MATITFATDELADSNGDSVTTTGTAIAWASFLGAPGSLTEYQSGTGDLTSGAITLSSITSIGAHTVVLRNTAGTAIGSYTKTAA